MPLSIHALTPTEFVAAAPLLVDVYLHAMKYPARLRESRIAAWEQDSTLPGFRAFCALHTPVLSPPRASRTQVAPSEPAGASPSAPRTPPIHQADPAHIAGVVYGFHGSADTWWHQQVQRGLLYRHHSATLLDDYFEVTEVHVAPAYQGRGVGRNLLARLLDGLPEPTALLSTPEVPGEANRAFRLYRSFGFRDVLRSFYFPGDSRPFAVLGAPLPLASPLPARESPTG
ncbi:MULTISPECIES: N-acetyltransferase [unclassified Corynebacterium]|uniref:GNAT family N-acetyltransferase n=1 Tax=unclassified Corynebacterium TaxID=2624378 RepID=UPI0029CA9634|nr:MULTISPECIES: N-acetyltransferase [unclassified Corynebacterium]WPF65452.1 N-acetyltransferase [Corynebacterium sp. 22KM0430]WPF67948.1 N-acetyltransferase [Corynebacterium sp. 21KM1197]